MGLYIGLVHYPVYNKNKKKIASAITNLDLHDLARLSRTYGVKKFFVITPLTDQQKLTESLVDHWKNGFGASYNVDRKEAIEVIKITPTIREAEEEVTGIENEKPLVIATSASRSELAISFKKAAEIIDSKKTVFLLFGTAWGLHSSVLDNADFILQPVDGKTGYNHLSVRTAAAIILDRLIGGFH